MLLAHVDGARLGIEVKHVLQAVVRCFDLVYFVVVGARIQTAISPHDAYVGWLWALVQLEDSAYKRRACEYVDAAALVNAEGMPLVVRLEGRKARQPLVLILGVLEILLLPHIGRSLSDIVKLYASTDFLLTRALVEEEALGAGPNLISTRLIKC